MAYHYGSMTQQNKKLLKKDKNLIYRSKTTKQKYLIY